MLCCRPAFVRRRLRGEDFKFVKRLLPAVMFAALLIVPAHSLKAQDAGSTSPVLDSRARLRRSLLRRISRRKTRTTSICTRLRCVRLGRSWV